MTKTRTSTIFDVIDDSIPMVEGVPTNSFQWLKDLFEEVYAFIFTAAHQLSMTVDLVSVLWYTFVLPLT